MYKTLYAFMVALLSGSAAFAQIHKTMVSTNRLERTDSSMTSRTYNLNPVVVTGSGHHQRLKSTATPVRVLSSQDIKEQGITTRVSPLSSFSSCRECESTARTMRSTPMEVSTTYGV